MLGKFTVSDANKMNRNDPFSFILSKRQKIIFQQKLKYNSVGNQLFRIKIKI